MTTIDDDADLFILSEEEEDGDVRLLCRVLCYNALGDQTK
jgi:hypothetical protein